MRLSRLFFALPLLLLLGGCGEPQVDLSAPNSHRSGDIAFDYPKKWKITEDLVSPAVHLLFVQSTGDALVILQSYPADEAVELAVFSSEFSKAAADDMSVGKIVDSKFSELPAVNGFEWLMEEFRVNLLGESLPHRRLYGAKEIGGRQVFLVFQVATEDFPKAEPGFDLIWKSLRSVSEEG